MKIRFGSNYNVYWLLPTAVVTSEPNYQGPGFSYFILSIGWWKWSIDIIFKDEDYND
jgi:hypothetical protein